MMTDLLYAKYVEVLVDDNNKLWLNIDGRCVVRIGCAENLRVEVAGMITHDGKRTTTSIERHHAY